MDLATICKLRILHQYVFRNTNPAIFGVKVEAGKLKHQINFIDEKGEKVGKIKNIQSEKKTVQEANEGTEVAVSMSGINFERVMKDRNFIYSDLGESQFRNFKKNKDLLSGNEMKILQEIAEIKRRDKTDWGM
jgi:translation initiation factor 5B